jgi:hypothetical protein
MRVIDEFYERHPEQLGRSLYEVAAFIRRLPPAERDPLVEATGALARAASRPSGEKGERH